MSYIIIAWLNYFSVITASWSPTIDSPNSPNAYPPPPPSHAPLRRSESPFPHDARGSPLAVDARPPHHPRFVGRGPGEAPWRKDAQRRGYMLARCDERSFFQGGKDVHVTRHANHLSVDRDPRIRRVQPQQQHGPRSPQSHKQSGSVPVTVSRAKRVDQILSEHAYFNKSTAPEASNEAPSNASQIDESQGESQMPSLPRHLLTPVPPVITKITKAPTLQTTYTLKNLPEVLKLLGTCVSKAEMSTGSSVVADEGIALDSSSKILKNLKEPLFSNALIEKGKPLVSEKEGSQVKPSEAVPSHPLQMLLSSDSNVLSTPTSLDSFEMDLDTEPDSSSDEEREPACDRVPESPAIRSSDIDQHLDSLPSIDLTSEKTTNIAIGRQPSSVIESGKVGQCNNRILRNGRVHSRSSVVYSTRRQPVAVVADKKFPSVRLSLSSSVYSKVEESAKQEDLDAKTCPQSKMRRSKRLATSLDNDSIELAKQQDAKSSTDTEGMVWSKLAESEMSREERMRLNLVYARSVKKRKRSLRVMENDTQRTTRSVR